MRKLLTSSALLFGLALLGLPLFGGVAQAKEAPLKPGDVHVLKSPKHEREFHLIVPSKYSKKRSWPLVISSHGRGGSGKGEMGAWRALANKHGFIVACPDMVTATNHREKTSSLSAADEDDEVVMSIIAFVRERFRVNGRAVMITGFSGGGNPSYHSGLRHPDVITHICTRGGNFAPQQMPSNEAVRKAGKSTLRIYIFYGDRDHVLILGENGQPGQAQLAYDALKREAYEHVTIEKIANMGHQSRPGTAAQWFADWIRSQAKAFKAGDKADAQIAKGRKAKQDEKFSQAIRAFKKALDIQTKAGIRTDAQAELDTLQSEGAFKLADARALHAKGDVPGALKLLAQIARHYKGLQAAVDAIALRKEWKP